MDNSFPEMKKFLGFGCMRLPLKDGKVNIEETKAMVDLFLEKGFNYFDTAHPYLNGLSELAVRECLTSRYPREKYLLADKLTEPYFKKEEDIRPFFENQLKWCGVDYFDFYLMHAQGAENYDKFQRCHAYETAFALKREGKIRHVGLSFHDKPEMLERILTDHPDVEFVQIQFNYIDYDNLSVESRRVYEVCRKFHKPVIVMEPVKGGSLVRLPEKAQAALDALNAKRGRKMSNASYAIRFAAGFEGIRMVLSGMSNLKQMQDNLSYMQDFQPLDAEEKAAIEQVVKVFRGLDVIPCTSCHYCIEENHCPKDILIPDIFAAYNSKKAFHNWNADFYYNSVLTHGHGKASDCVRCGGCEKVCPQHLPIRNLLKDAAAEFEKEKEEKEK
jgi:predicted aldo/keto reductase-like oxidoreductase